MERVWKRVALSRRRPPSGEEKVAERRTSCYVVGGRKSSKSAARDFMWCDANGSDSSASPPPSPPPPAARATKTFSLHLDSRMVIDLNPAALTKCLCSRATRKKQDNRLYRSNSFHFKRYDRPEQTPLENQVSICDEYSLPVDFINRRTRSFGSGLANWTSSPNTENLQVLTGYSDPRDCKAYLEPGQAPSTKVYASPDADKYSNPHSHPPKASGPSLHPGSSSKHPSKRRKRPLTKVSQSLDLPSQKRSLPKVLTAPEEQQWRHDAELALSEEAPSHECTMPCDVLVRSRSSVCVPCKGGSLEEDDPDLGDMENRNGRKQIYETAFDSKVSKSEDELDEVDRVSNHPVLRMFSRAARGLTPRAYRKPDAPSKEAKTPDAEEDIAKAPEVVTPRPASAVPGRLVVKLGELRLASPPPVAAASSSSPMHTYTPSPPSTAPLPAKFHPALVMSSMQSAPDLPGGRLKELHLASKARGRSRPNSLLLAAAHAPTKPKFSSTESMTTSSSMSSLESLRSSTSEGNRSSTSSGSKRSDSLSSHSSDSGGDIRRMPLTRHLPLGLLTNKLHILSPISDKSQEPGSETSDNNRNNNSQKTSPDEVAKEATPTMPTDELPWDAPKMRRRLQTKNVINLQLDGETLQASDSGISIASRHLENLPFDMPKLRRRLAAGAPAPNSATSSSATSVASSSKPEELPFDMPKLRRRQLRSSLETFSIPSSSNATDSASGDGAPSRPPSLDLGGPSAFRPIASSTNRPERLGLNFRCNPILTRGDIDPSIPLERQGWFHGAITRVEAEAELRLHSEGSFLVRNSESSRQDFSLSLKSARGFMHMRIQQETASGQYILGQFSKPFASIPEMVYHYSLNRLPIRGAEHMCLLQPVIEQLL